MAAQFRGRRSIRGEPGGVTRQRQRLRPRPRGDTPSRRWLFRLVNVATVLVMLIVVMPLFSGDPLEVPSRDFWIAVVIGYGIGVVLFDVLPVLVRWLADALSPADDD